jgi:tetratricopeptide (TPR) repeat protein
LRDKLHASIAKGNKYYERGEHDKALEEYRKASDEDSLSAIPRFNAGDALYRMGKFKDGAGEFMKTAASSSDSIAAMSYYNLGNTAFKSGDFRGAAEAYKRSLLMNPDDGDAKFNLEYALRMIQQQQQQQQQNQDKNQQTKPDQQQQQQQQQQEQQEQQNQAAENQQPQPSQGDLTPDELKRILAAIDASDRQTQQELLKRAARTKHLTEKDW